jgi:tetratricopeptide (TPR) repeat protein
MTAAQAGAAQPTGAPVPNPPTPGTSANPTNGLTILYPFDETVFPPDIAPPTFRWRGPSSPACDTWEIRMTFSDNPAPLPFTVRVPQWMPDSSTWESIKRRSRERPVHVEVLGYQGNARDQPVCRASLGFSTSRDEVGAPIFYRDVNLPFVEAVKDPSKIRWRFGDISSPQPPPVVLERLPVCGNCHSFSRDGKILGMDVDYANSKGSYVITRTASQMVLKPQEIITWDDYRREDHEQTFGLLSQVSPDGQWVVSTVKDKSVFVPRPDLAFSQLFFPLKGILALYHRASGTFQSLPGADRPEYVQSNPTWSPDGRYLVFARTLAHNLSNTVGQGKVLLMPEECREFLKDGKPFRFDLYRIPFNDGKGGEPEPLTGATGGNCSHYFPRYSPDGRWIVFCRANSYMLLQPDSELYIIPAEGGQARRLRCNLSRMNSWHSWSPNGRWLVFSSKAFSDYTQLFLTHIDSQGHSTPAVLLDRFTETNRAANIPEFVNLPPNGIARIREDFLNDYSFERAAFEFYRSGEPDRAIENYRQALKLNPKNAAAHQRLGFLLYNVKRQTDEGLSHTAEALRLDPKNGLAHNDMAMALLNQNRVDEAITHFRAALESLRLSAEENYKPQTILYHLAKACVQQGRYPEAATHLQESVHLNPANARAHYLLALAWVCQGKIDETVQSYAKAMALQPAVDTSAVLHEMLAENYAKAGRRDDAIHAAEHALKLARSARNTEAVQRIGDRLRQYQAGEP